MGKPESKTIGRRELLLGLLAATVIGPDTKMGTTIRERTANTIEPEDADLREFAYLDERIKHYKSIVPTMHGSVNTIPDFHKYTDPEYLESRHFEEVPEETTKPVQIDFEKVPGGKVMPYTELVDTLKGDIHLRDVTVLPAHEQNDTGTVCILYGQMHHDSDSKTGVPRSVNPYASDSQTRLSNSGQDLISKGVRFFAIENMGKTFPSKTDRPGASDGYKRIQDDIDTYNKLLGEYGFSGFEALHMAYPFIDANGVFEPRVSLMKATGIARALRDGLGHRVKPFHTADALLNEKRAKAYVKYLKKQGEQGAALLGDIELYYSASMCVSTAILDEKGTQFLYPVIHQQLKHMQEVLADPSFLKAQEGRNFAPNVFAMQYGLIHSSIPMICQKLGISCISVNATRVELSTISQMQEKHEKIFESSHQILANLRS